MRIQALYSLVRLQGYDKETIFFGYANLFVASRRLSLFLSLLLHADEGCQSDAFLNRRKDSYNAILSILQSIKNSEDVDGVKSNVSN